MPFFFEPPTLPDPGPTVEFAIPAGVSNWNNALLNVTVSPTSDTASAVEHSRGPDQWLIVMANTVSALSELKPGWDGADGEPVSRDALYSASRITRDALEGREAMVAPHVIPCADGSVQVEWHRHSGELELVVGGDGSLTIWGRDNGSGAEFEGDDEEAIDLFFRWAPRMASAAYNGASVQTSFPTFAIAA